MELSPELSETHPTLSISGRLCKALPRAARLLIRPRPLPQSVRHMCKELAQLRQATEAELQHSVLDNYTAFIRCATVSVKNTRSSGQRTPGGPRLAPPTRAGPPRRSHRSKQTSRGCAACSWVSLPGPSVSFRKPPLRSPCCAARSSRGSRAPATADACALRLPALFCAACLGKAETEF